MKAYNIETKSYHKVVSVNYDTNDVVLETETGRLMITIDKVRLIQDRDEVLKGRTIIHPELFWMIPFVGWFMVPYKLFTIKDCVIMNESLRDSSIMMIAGFGPIIIFLLFLIFSLK